ncbi:MAG: phosphotransferase, partial [Gammaproteobacteria bacterium]|nr:phosphotransferase [Gammaproteobacteria bacterium]
MREGEELDLNCLRQYLEPVLGSAAASLEAKQFPGGFSNLTYLLSSGDEKWVLRRPPFGSKVKSAHDMLREYKILSALQKVYSY